MSSQETEGAIQSSFKILFKNSCITTEVFESPIETQTGFKFEKVFRDMAHDNYGPVVKSAIEKLQSGVFNAIAEFSPDTEESIRNYGKKITIDIQFSVKIA